MQRQVDFSRAITVHGVILMNHVTKKKAHTRVAKVEDVFIRNPLLEAIVQFRS